MHNKRYSIGVFNIDKQLGNLNRDLHIKVSEYENLFVYSILESNANSEQLHPF